MPKTTTTTTARPGVIPGLRAVAYLRVSTGLQADKGAGLDVQRQAVTEFAEAQGLDLIAVVSETASGAVRAGDVFSWEHRPVLLNLIARARTDEFDVLLVAKFDRLTREASDLPTLGRMLATGKRPVRIMSASEDNGDGAVGKLMRHTLAGFAEFERDVIRGRLSAGKALRKLEGRHVHGRIPYGYSSTAGVLERDEAQAAIVRRIFADAKAGRSAGAIARGLDADEIHGPTGRGWDRTTVLRMLGNITYTGEKYGVRKAHPAIVSRRAWNAAQAALAARARS